APVACQGVFARRRREPEAVRRITSPANPLSRRGPCTIVRPRLGRALVGRDQRGSMASSILSRNREAERTTRRRQGTQRDLSVRRYRLGRGDRAAEHFWRAGVLKLHVRRRRQPDIALLRQQLALR